LFDSDPTRSGPESRLVSDPDGILTLSRPGLAFGPNLDSYPTRTRTPFAAINAVVWPCLLLLVGVSLWLGLCLGCWSVGSDAALVKEEYGAGVVSLRLH